jgi:hypothetical protein
MIAQQEYVRNSPTKTTKKIGFIQGFRSFLVDYKNCPQGKLVMKRKIKK